MHSLSTALSKWGVRVFYFFDPGYPYNLTAQINLRGINFFLPLPQILIWSVGYVIILVFWYIVILNGWFLGQIGTLICLLGHIIPRVGWNLFFEKKTQLGPFIVSKAYVLVSRISQSYLQIFLFFNIRSSIKYHSKYNYKKTALQKPKYGHSC